MQKAQVRFVNKERSLFFPTLNKRVDDYFKKQGFSKNANAEMKIKTVVILASYFIPFSIILATPNQFWFNIFMWSLMGFGLAGIGMSIMHDANHGSYSKKQWVNDLLGYTLNFAGGSVFNWKLQHNFLHHTYTNVPKMDDDIDDKLIMRFSPSLNVKWYHKFQVVYVFLFYSILTIYWTVLKDFIQFARYTKNGVNHNKRNANIKILLKIIAVKILYFIITIFIPYYFFGHNLKDLFIGFLVMHLLAGSVLSLIFQLAHTVEGTSHPIPDENGIIENDWAIHQMNTTVDFSPNNKLLSWYIGGLNFQVEHHLFPRVCHVHYPELAKIVKQTAKEFNIPYLVNENFFDAVKSHLNTLRKFGMPKIDEIMA